MMGHPPLRSKAALLLILTFCTLNLFSQTTSWNGSEDNRWRNTDNWTNGVPDASTDAIIGNVSITNQPTLRKGSGQGVCKSLTIGGTFASTLTVLDGFDIYGTLTIEANGVINDNSGRTTILGDWLNSGSYIASGANRRVYFEGTNQSIGGSSVTNFERLYISSGNTVTLAQDMVISNFIDLSGSFDPSTHIVTGAGDINITSGAALLVKASTFGENYANSGDIDLEASSSVIDYAASAINQTIDQSIVYNVLRISGDMTKSLSGNTTVQNDLYIQEGTLDLLGFTANRSSAGGSIVLASSATLMIGGTNSFPSNYSTHVLSSLSTVAYNGDNQVVSSESYGNLTLSGTSGAVIKTMPASALTMAGNLTATVSGGSLSFTAGNSIAVLGDINLGTFSTFDGATFSHSTNGDWVNNGIYNGCSSTFSFNGTGTTISGSGTFNYGEVIINGNGTSMDQNTSVSMCGDFSTVGGGTFVHSTGGTGQITLTGAGSTISGSNIAFHDLITAVTSSVSTTGTFKVAGDFTADGAFTATSGTVNFSGTGTILDGAAPIQFAGLTVTGTLSMARNLSISSQINVLGGLSASAGTVTFNGTSTLSGSAHLYDLLVSTSGSLKMGSGSTLGIANTGTIDAGGSFDPTSNVPNTVNYNGSGAQSLEFSDYDNLTVSGGNTKTPSTNLTINGDLTIDVGTTLDGTTLTHSIGGSWLNNGTFTTGTSSIELIGVNDTNISGATTFNNLTINKNPTNKVTLTSDVEVDLLAMTSGNMLTGANTVTITTTRSGSGIILGRIIRQHTYDVSTDYVFSGPNNIINFTAIVGTINSITVQVSASPNLSFPAAASINRIYEIDLAGSITSYLATLRVHYEQHEINGNVEGMMTFWNDGGDGTWTDQGKNSNDDVNNWVELNSITSLQDVWTLSEGLIKYSWMGTIDDTWENMNNWNPNIGTPTIQDVVYLGDEIFTNQPIITSTENIKKLYFDSTTPTTLTLSSGGELTVQGNIDGVWSADATHTIDVGAQTLSTLSDIVLSAGVANRNINLTASTGTINIEGSLTQAGDADITFTDAATVNLNGGFNYVSGTFTPATSIVNANGTALQHFGGVTFNHLNITKSSGSATINAETIVNGDLTLTNNAILRVESALSVIGDVNIGSGTTLTVPDVSTISVSGNWNLSGDFVPGSGNIAFNGSGSQTMDPSTFNNFILNKPSGTLTLLGDVTINGDIDVQSGTIEVSTFDVARSSFGGTASMSAGTTARFGGTGLQIINFSTLIADPTSTIEYYSTSPRIIAPIEYGNLIISNGGSNAKTMVGPTTVQGDLTVNSGSTLSAASTTLTLEGDFTMNGDFDASGGTIVLDGSGVINGDITYNDMVINGSYDFLSGSITFDGNLNVTASGDFDAGTLDVISNGDFTNSGIVESYGTVTFLGTQLQNIRLLSAIISSSSGVINFNGTVAPVLSSTSSPLYSTLNINNTAPIIPSQPWTVIESMNISSGATWEAGPLTHTIYGDFNNAGTVHSSGKLIFSPSTAASVDLGTNFTTTGEIEFGGIGEITLTDDNPVFENVTITNTSGTGITPSTPWVINQNILIGAGAILNGASTSHTVSGSWVNNGTFDGQTSSVTFDSSTGNDAIIGTGSNNFNNVIFDTDASIEVTANLNINSNFTNNATTLNLLDQTVKFEGASLSTLNGTTTTIFDDLEIDKSANLQIAIDATVNEALILTNGALDLNGFELSITNEDPSAVIRANGYILSENTSFNSVLSWSVGSTLSLFEFPFGNPSGDYIPFLFDLNSGDAGIVSVSTYLTGADNLPLPPGVSNINSGASENSANLVDRFYSVTLSGNTSPEADITFQASAAEVGSITTLQAQQWTTEWEDPLPSQVAGATSVMIPGVSAFGTWAISGNDVALPVEMTLFSARQTSRAIHISWETASEQNNDYFELQKSNDGKQFYKLSIVKGNGTVNEKSSYSFQDETITSNRQYYRLKQVDFDGTETISKVIFVDTILETISWDVYPNPATDRVHIISTDGDDHDIRLILYNSEGKIVIDQMMYRFNANEAFDLNIKHLPSGVYLLNITSPNQQRTVHLAIR